MYQHIKNWQKLLAFASFCISSLERFVINVVVAFWISRNSLKRHNFKYKRAYTYVCCIHTCRYTYIYIGRIYAVNYAPATICQLLISSIFRNEVEAGKCSDVLLKKRSIHIFLIYVDINNII